MKPPQAQTTRFRFDAFELDSATGELYKDGQRVKLQDQPARLLILLASRAGELVSREEIQSALWEEGQFVEFEHAINVAIKKIREALDDDPVKPRFVETLPRKGYRFIGTLQATAGRLTEAVVPEAVEQTAVTNPEPPSAAQPAQPRDDELVLQSVLPTRLARALFLGVQVLYLAIYTAALVHIYEVAHVVGEAGLPWLALPVLIGAACAIPVRLYLIFTVGLKHPAAGLKYRRMLPYLMVWDWLWAPSPFLAIDTFGPGWALVCSAILVYPPVSQLILMRSIHPSDLPRTPQFRRFR